MSIPENSIERIARAFANSGSSASSDLDLNPGMKSPAVRYRSASVLIPVIERHGQARVILTRRSAALKNHAGQVAFPGGKQDAADGSPLAAALREASEEIGLGIGQVRIIGTMAPHRTGTGFEVSPFVGHVFAEFRATPDPKEVAEIFEVPLDFLLAPANYQIHSRVWNGVERHFYAIPYGPHYIWGATARMLRALADHVRAGP